ncbi:MAG: helix-turn-helix domain-containing protein [Actinomycetota bacterium]
MATQAERRAATRRALIDAATARFAAEGYDETSTDRIREDAGVSRGAVYHHFPSKRDLFEAVFEEVSSATIRRSVSAAEPGGSPLADLTASCLAWLREVQDPQAAAILLDLGPHVLGWERARGLEAETSRGLMETALERAASAQEIDVPSIPIAAQLLNAVLAEAALVAVNGSPAGPPDEIEAAVRQFIAGLAARSQVDG